MQKTHLLTFGFATSLLLLSACSPSNHSSLHTSGDAIIGGTEVAPTDLINQSIVGVYDSDEGQLCTGSLLPGNLVLTAAHCIGSDPELMMVIFDTKLSESSTARTVDKIEVSPYWDTQGQQAKNKGDIALIHFTGSVPTGYKPATFLPAASKNKLKAGTTAVIAGYGITDGTTHEGAGTLRTTTVKIDNPLFSESEVTVNQKNGQGACHGDSGGPAYLLINGKYYLWGVTSRGVEDTENTCLKLAAYTNALYYKNWISRMATKLTRSLVAPQVSR